MTQSRRSLWTAKLKGKTVSSSLTALRLQKPFVGKALGVDPSLRGTGLAVVEALPGGQLKLCHSQTLRMPPSVSFSQCLGEIFIGVKNVLNDHNVHMVALEQTIFVQNIKIAQILGASRGAAIAAAAIHGLTVAEYPPLRVKKSIVGVGNATKQQVAHMLANLLKLPSILPHDESDAASVALCHIFTTSNLIQSL